MSKETDEERAARALDELTERGVQYVVLTFCGGHDEGSVDHAALYGERKPDADAAPADYEQRLLTLDRRHEQIELPSGEVWGLVGPLDFPIYRQYGSFAGECSIYGTVTWDVASRSAVMHSEETVWQENEVREYTAVGHAKNTAAAD
jgi:hypothetical protein